MTEVYRYQDTSERQFLYFVNQVQKRVRTESAESIVIKTKVLQNDMRHKCPHGRIDHQKVYSGLRSKSWEERKKVRDSVHLKALTTRNRSFVVDHLDNKEVVWCQKD